MPRPIAQTCFSCRWWWSEDAPLPRDMAECRQGPPCGVTSEPDPARPYLMVPRPLWPVTRSSDWCGRHLLREHLLREPA